MEMGERDGLLIMSVDVNLGPAHGAQVSSCVCILHHSILTRFNFLERISCFVQKFSSAAVKWCKFIWKGGDGDYSSTSTPYNILGLHFTVLGCAFLLFPDGWVKTKTQAVYMYRFDSVVEHNIAAAAYGSVGT